ncbi:MAG: Transcriptional regulatory protein EmbR [Pseudomonadota bacterium]
MPVPDSSMTLYWLKHRGTLFPVLHGDCLLGRSPGCLIVLGSERVSREHAVVRRIHSGLQIEDLGSRNGTWVNGARIRYPTVLQPGDEILLGEDLLEVVIRQNPQVPVTVSGLVSPLGPETEQQLRAIEQVEDAVSQLGPHDDMRAAAHRLRPALDDLMARQAERGLVFAPDEARRLVRVARTLALWSENHQFERWFQDVLQRLTGGAPA